MNFSIYAVLMRPNCIQDMVFLRIYLGTRVELYFCGIFIFDKGEILTIICNAGGFLLALKTLSREATKCCFSGEGFC